MSRLARLSDMGVPKAPRRRPMIQSVKVKNLSLSKDNVRKSNREADLASLAADIEAHGLLQNLVVTPLKKAGHFTVKEGGRRLRAIHARKSVGEGRGVGESGVLGGRGNYKKKKK